VTSGGQEKELFYVLEKKNEGLILIPRHGTMYREDTATFDMNPYIESRIRIHPSLGHPDGNTIHRTLVSQKIARSTYIWTDAVKKKTGFTPVFWKLCSNMTLGYEPKRSGAVVHLGAYDPSDFVLCYAVLVSSLERRFFLNRPLERLTPINNTDGIAIPCYFAKPSDFYAVDHAFKRFRITLLISYLGAPSINFEHMFHHQTFRENDPNIALGEEDYYRKLIKGRDEVSCLSDFNVSRTALFEKYLDADDQAQRDHFRNLGRFYANPSKASAEFQRFYQHEVRLYALFNPAFFAKKAL
jgi:hypothetical protein